MLNATLKRVTGFWPVLRNFLIVLTIVSIVVLPFIASASADEKCQVEIGAAGIGVVVCGGETVEQLPLPTIKVTVPGPTITDIIRVPGPTVTVKAPVETVTQPGPTATVTVSSTEVVEGPGATETIPGPTSTITNSQAVTGASTAATEASTPFSIPTSAFVPKIPEEDDFVLPDGVVKAGISFLSAIIALACALFAMYVGYILGYKDQERKSQNFMQALSDRIRSQRKR